MKTPHILSRSCKFNFTAHPGSLFSHPSCRHGWPNQFLSKIPYVLLQCLDYITHACQSPAPPNWAIRATGHKLSRI